MWLAIQRSNKAKFKEAITKQCSTELPGLGMNLNEDMLEALYLEKSQYESTDKIYMCSAVGYTMLPTPGTPFRFEAFLDESIRADLYITVTNCITNCPFCEPCGWEHTYFRSPR